MIELPFGEETMTIIMLSRFDGIAEHDGQTDIISTLCPDKK